MSIPLWILIIIGSIFGIVLTGGTVIGFTVSLSLPD